MYDRPTNRPAALLALALIGGVAACDESPQDTMVSPDFSIHAETGWERTSFDVYTQNLFLGGDTGPLFDPAVISNPVALIQAVGTFWADVQDSDVVARMAEIADEIALQNPEVVGVQEALQFVTLNGSFQPDGAGYVDLLAALQGAIAAKGLPYVLEIAQATTSSALPMEIDFSTGAVTRYLGFTDRVAVLRRTDVQVTDAAGGVYTAAIPLAPGVAIQRGWARVTVDHEGTAHHFVATHLETQGVRPVHDGQAFELINGVLASLPEGVTVLVGDLNSDAEASEGDPSWTPTYGNLIDAGFADLWELSPHARTDPGFTCCQDPSLRNGVSELDERIDFVLVRSSEGPIPGEGNRRGHFRADVVGDRSSDLTGSGLWPSDHAGLVGSIRNTDGTAED